MAKIESFEDIVSWQKARILNLEIYKITNGVNFTKDFGLKDQIRRASISIMSNIAEGFERNGTKEFIQFLSIAKASCGEVRCQLYIAVDLGYIDKSEFDVLYEQCKNISKLISGFITYLKDSEFKGSKFY